MDRAEAIERLEIHRKACGFPMPHMESASAAAEWNMRMGLLSEALSLGIAALREQESKWISVEERLPEYGKYVLVADERNRFIGLFSLEKTEENYVFWRGMRNWTMDVIAITHWMPLPQPPEV